MNSSTFYRQFQQQRHCFSEQTQANIHAAANEFLVSFSAQTISPATNHVVTSNHWWQRLFKTPLFKVSSFSTPQSAAFAMVLLIVIGSSLFLTIKPLPSNQVSIWETDALANCYSCGELATLSATALRGTLPNNTMSAAVSARQLGRLAASLTLLKQLPSNHYQAKSIHKALNRAIIISQTTGLNALQQLLQTHSQQDSTPSTARDSLSTLENFFQNSAQQSDYSLGKDLETAYISSLSHQQDNNPAAMQQALQSLTRLQTRLEQNSHADIADLMTLITAAQNHSVISQQQAGHIAQRLQTVITALTR